MTPAALQSVRNVPRIVCAKVERGPKLRRRSVAAASEDVPPVPCETCVNSAGWPSATCPVVSLAMCSLPCKALASDNKSYEWHKPRTGLFLKGKDARAGAGVGVGGWGGGRSLIRRTAQLEDKIGRLATGLFGTGRTFSHLQMAHDSPAKSS